MKTTRRINFSAWGRGDYDVPAYAMRSADEYRSTAEVVASAIARKSGLVVVTLRSDGVALANGEPYEAHYQTTLGTPCPGGGWTPMAEVGFAVAITGKGPS